MSTKISTSDFAKMQFQLALARVSYWQALAVSGGYKSIRTQRGHGKNPDGTTAFRDLTDDEKLEHVLSAVKAHLRFAQECLDSFETEGGAEP